MPKATNMSPTITRSMGPLQAAHELSNDDAIRFLDLRLVFDDRRSVGRMSRKLTNRFCRRRQNIPRFSRGALCACVQKTTFKNRAGGRLSATSRTLLAPYPNPNPKGPVSESSAGTVKWNMVVHSIASVSAPRRTTAGCRLPFRHALQN